jgi:hypothetical protein
MHIWLFAQMSPCGATTLRAPFALEVYNDAILPAIQSPLHIGKLRSEACSAKMKAIIDTVPPSGWGKANAKLKREYGDYLTDQ